MLGFYIHLSVAYLVFFIYIFYLLFISHMESSIRVPMALIDVAYTWIVPRLPTPWLVTLP